MKVAPVPAPDDVRAAVAELSERTGLRFTVSSVPVGGTELFVVWAAEHPLPDRYTASSGILGFRVPRNFPDAAPEDCFFLRPQDLKLKTNDPVRLSPDINRASVSQDFCTGTELDGGGVLVFSWHIWNKVPWNRRKHTLIDHYTHCVRRFDEPEHDR